MDLFAPRHLLIVLVVCLLVFGTKKLKTLGSDLGSAVKGFKKAMSEGESEDLTAASPAEANRSHAELAAPASQQQSAAGATTAKSAV